MTGRIKRTTTLLVAISFLLTIESTVAFKRTYEKSKDLSAAEILPAKLLKGEHHTVDDRVRNDGYLNYYEITSDFGEFEAASTAMLRIRVGEIQALAALDELSKTEVFIEAAANAGVDQVKSIYHFATRPVKTIFGIPRGIGRMFKRYTREADEAVGATKKFVAGGNNKSDETNGENKDDSNKAMALTEWYFRVSSAERAWAQKLGTDPYSTNETLLAAVKQVAWAERLGKFGVGFVSIPTIPGADIIGRVSVEAWSKSPYELRDLNRARLVGTGAEEALIKEYLDNPRMTPSQQTLLAAAIAELADVEGRSGILRQALNPRTEAEVGFFIKSVTLLVWYHLNQNSLVSVNTDAAIPAGLTDDGIFVVLIAADHAYWTEGVAQAAVRFTKLAARAETDGREVWYLGSTSERCRHEMTTRGWDVHDNLAVAISDESPK